MKYNSRALLTIPLLVTSLDAFPSKTERTSGSARNMTAVTERKKQLWTFPKYFSCHTEYTVDYKDDKYDKGDATTIYAYTLAVSGDKASLTVTSHDDNTQNSVLYFNVDAKKCDPRTSYQVSQFQVWDKVKKQGKSERQCWMAPDKYMIDTGVPVLHSSIFKFMFSTSEKEFIHVGSKSFKDQTVDIWKQKCRGAVECELLTSKGTASRVQFTITQKKYTTTVSFLNFEEYSKPRDVPNAEISMKEKKKCNIFSLTDTSVKACKGDLNGRATSSEDIALEEIEDQLNSRPTGYEDHVRSNGYPSTGTEYEMLGSQKQQDFINSLRSFVPEMVGRQMIPVQKQGCGDCYAFSTSHSITSTYFYANRYKDLSGVFSPQRLSNCALLEGDSGSGCFGGNPKELIDMLVHHLKGRLPFPQGEPYVGFQGFCDDPKTKGYDTSVIGYMNIKTIDEMKNALYYRGDVVVIVQSNFPDSYSETYSWPSNNLKQHKKAHLGTGSSQFLNETDHAVVAVGWAPCNVQSCKMDSKEKPIETECWILQNSWGTGYGINNGFDIVDTDVDCDHGVLSAEGAIIPILKKKQPTKRLT